MAVEYDISSDVAVIKETGSVSQCARVTQMYSGQITYDDEAGSKFATATINGKSQRVMLCIAVSGTVTYDDVPSLYSTVDGHRCLNIVTPTETGTPDDVPSLYETVVIDGQNVRAVRCIMINKTPVYDGVSSVCTFTGDDGKTHTAQLVNKITGGSVQVIIKGTSPLNLPDAIANSLSYVKAFGGTEQNGTPTPDAPVDIVSNNGVLKVNSQGQIYTDGTVETIKDSLNNTATTKMLLKVGNYQDIQEILSGAVTRNVGVKMFDGTETFIKPADGYAFQLADALGQTSGVGLCTHFKTSPASGFYVQFGASRNKYVYFRGTNTDYPTQADFKQYLTGQYNAGTPVIVIYPLATATTESVTGQTLQVTSGDNIVEITQASLNGLELEAKYQAAVSLTIQEVQDANLDNSVEVTIS